VSLSIGRKQPIVVGHSRQSSVGLCVCPCVCLSVCSVHCGKTVDRIWMRFGMVGRTASGMRQVFGFGDQSTGKGNFGGNFGARHCNQWGLFGATRPCFQITLGRLVSICVQSAFRVSTSTKLDDRIFAMEQCKTLPVLYLIQSIYPDLYPVHALSDKVRKSLVLTIYLKLKPLLACWLLGSFYCLLVHR